MSHRVAAVLTLVVVAPVTAEFLLGDQYAGGSIGPTQLVMLALYVLFYGFGAVGIREIARRRGGGWPAILLLGSAFGLVQEALLTQSLFNPDYAGQHLGAQGAIGFLGISAPWAVYVLVLHPVWSIAAPIAVTERLFGTEPWLGRPGRWVTAVSYVLGALATLGTSLLISDGFVASPAQLLVAAALAAALVVAAVRRTPTHAWVGGNQLLGLGVGFVLATAFQLTRLVGVGPWVAVVWMLLVVVVAVALVRWLRPGPFGLGAGAVLTYGWLGILTVRDGGVGVLVEQSLLLAASVALLVVAARRPWAGRPAVGDAPASAIRA